MGDLTCQDSVKSKMATLERCFGLARVGGEKLIFILFWWGFRRLGKIPVVKSHHLSPEDQNASQSLHNAQWSQCMLMPAGFDPQGFVVSLKTEISLLGGKSGSCERYIKDIGELLDLSKNYWALPLAEKLSITVMSHWGRSAAEFVFLSSTH